MYHNSPNEGWKEKKVTRVPAYAYLLDRAYTNINVFLKEHLLLCFCQIVASVQCDIRQRPIILWYILSTVQIAFNFK